MIMTPQERADELTDKFSMAGTFIGGLIPYSAATQCAIICVEEIIEAVTQHRYSSPTYDNLDYWQSVLTILKTKA